MTWGVEPTNPELLLPVSRRVGGRVRVEWRGNGNEHEALIEHHDKRLWVCQTGRFNTELSEFRRYKFYARLASAGCQPLRLVGRSLLDLRQLVERFANMSRASYEVLIADAEPTTSHPLAGTVVQVTIRREIRRQRGFLPTDYGIEINEEVRVGRADGPHITLFPSMDEVMAVLGDLQSADAAFIVPDRQPATPAGMVTTNREVMTPRRQELQAAAVAVEAAIPPERSNRAIRL